LTKIIIKEENFKWHLEAFASELFIYFFFFNLYPYWNIRSYLGQRKDIQLTTTINTSTNQYPPSHTHM